MATYFVSENHLPGLAEIPAGCALSCTIVEKMTSSPIAQPLEVGDVIYCTRRDGVLMRYELFPKQTSQEEKEALLTTRVSDLPLPSRIRLCFQSEGWETLGTVLEKTETDLFKIPNFGRRSLADFNRFLESRGLRLRS